jgi:hypothetical protein
MTLQVKRNRAAKKKYIVVDKERKSSRNRKRNDGKAKEAQESHQAFREKYKAVHKSNLCSLVLRREPNPQVQVHLLLSALY